MTYWSPMMPTLVTTTARHLARLAWAFLYLLASRPVHRYPWFNQKIRR